MANNLESTLTDKKKPTLFKRALARLRRNISARAPFLGQRSFSQLGEDILVDWIFDALKLTPRSYLDIGANDPRRFNNTFRLYLRGARGVCVEPQPNLARRIRRARPGDQVVEAGIGPSAGQLTFFHIDADTLSTFDKNAAQTCVKLGHRITATEQIPVITASDLIAQTQISSSPDLLSIDIEGDESEIIKEMVSQGVRPKIIVCETQAYGAPFGGARLQHKVSTIESLGYSEVATTYINSVFVDEHLLPAHQTSNGGAREQHSNNRR